MAETGGPLPKELEIALVVPSFKSQYPGVYLFTTPARFLRPVLHLRTGAEELLSTFEQMYMHICCLPEARSTPGVAPRGSPGRPEYAAQAAAHQGTLGQTRMLRRSCCLPRAFE